MSEEIIIEHKQKVFKDIFYRKSDFVESALKAQASNSVRLFCEKKASSETIPEPPEVIERRRYRELKEKFNRELFNNADRISSVAKPLIISLVTAFVIDLFYWILAFTPHAGYMGFIGNICTFIQIFSIFGLISLFFYSFFTGRNITLTYDRLFQSFDSKLVVDLDYL